MKIFSILVLVVVIGFLGWGVLYLTEATVRQHDSESFPHVTGIVESSHVTTTHTSKGGTRYHVHISYHYSVDGVNYISYRYRYDGHPTDGESANAIVNSHQSGTVVEVYYNPQNPRDTVLSTGVDRLDVSMPLFVGGVGFFMLSALRNPLRQQFAGRNAVAGGVKIISEMMITRVRLPRYEPILLATWVAAGLSGLGALLIAINALQPPWLAGQLCLMAILLGATLVYAMQYRKLNSGCQDLVLDESGRILQLPLTYKRREQKHLSFTKVQSVMLSKVHHNSRGGGYDTFLVTLGLKDDTREKLVDLNKERAEAFATWLREKLGLPA
jgi:hypothetical protein